MHLVLCSLSAAAQTTPTWTPVGPGAVTYGSQLISGSTSALVVDSSNPQNVYSAFMGGGVWKSTNAGAAWSPLTDAQALNNVASLTQDPNDSRTLYAGGNGGSNTGYLKTTDGGITWTHNDGPFPGPIGADSFFGGSGTTFEIEAKPGNSQVLLLAEGIAGNTSKSGVYRSTDAGGTWSQVLSGQSANRVLFDPTNSSIAYAALCRGYGANGGFYKSTDAGVTWTILAGGLPGPSAIGGYFCTMNMSPSNPSKLVVSITQANGPVLYTSNDAGATWVQQTAPPGVTYSFVAFSPTNPNAIFIGGQSLFRSLDGGATWSSIGFFPAGIPGVYGYGFVGTTNQLYVGTAGGVFYTANSAAATVSFTNMTQSLATMQLNAGISVHPYDPSVILSGSFSGTVLYTGSTVTSEGCGVSGLTAIDQINPNNQYFVCLYTDIHRSTNGGASFTTANTGISTSESPAYLAPIAVDPSLANTVYYATNRVYQSTNAAASWTAISPLFSTINSISVSPKDSNSVYAAETNAVLVSANASSGTSSTWSEQRSGLPSRIISHVTADPVTPAIAYVTMIGYSGFGDTLGHVFKTTNRGTSWTDVSGNLPNLPAYDIAIDPDAPSNLYVATDAGVYASLNGGATWSRFGTGLPNVQVNAITFFHSTHLVRAGTNGRGLWSVAASPAPFTATPTVINFGHQAAATASNATAVVISNNLVTGTIAISGVSVTSDFTQTNDCPAILTASTTCTVNVVFSPTTAGALTGTLTVGSDHGPLSVSLIGNSFPIASPVFSPAAGTYGVTQSVTISDSTAGSSIYYTTNGSTPSTASTLYTGAIPVASTQTIKAIAIAPTYNASAIVSSTYTINPYGYGLISTFAGTGVAAHTGDGGQATAATLNSPLSLAIDGSGNVFIGTADLYIRKVTPAGIISTFAGNGGSSSAGDGGAATSASFAYPDGLAADSAGNVYVTDNYNNRIRKITAAGVISTFAGTGASAHSGDGGLATAAGVNHPESIAVDAAGNVYIAEQGSHTIRKVTPAGIISTVAGIAGSAGFSGDGGAATSAKLNGPFGIAVDSTGNLFIGDSGNFRVRKVNTAGTITTVAGNGTSGFSGDGAAATSASLGNFYSVAVDAAGNLYVPDLSNYRVRKITPTGIISTVAGNGVAAFAGDGGPATSASVNAPRAVAFDGGSNLFLADQGENRVRKVTYAPPLPVFSPGGGAYSSAQSVTITDAIGSASIYYTTDGSAATTSSTLYTEPVTIATASTVKAIAVVPGYNNSAAASATYAFVTQTPVFTPAAGTYAQTQTVAITSAPAGATIYYTTDGSTPTTQSTVYTGPITVGTSIAIKALAVSSAYGTSTVAAAAYTIDRSLGTITTVAGALTAGFAGDGGQGTSALLYQLGGVTFDRVGNLLIADAGSGRIRKLTPAGIITTIVGNGTGAYAGDGGQAISASLFGPQGVSVDAAGNLYIADTSNHAIRKVTPAGIISTVAGTGTTGFSGDGGPAINAALSKPRSVLVDAAGNLYIADSGNQRVRKVSPSGTITTLAGTGSAGFAGDGGPATSAQLNNPNGLAVDGSGNLYVADLTNSRIRMITPGGVISTFAGNGSTSFSGDGGSPAAAGLPLPEQVTLDLNGNVYVSTFTDGRVRKITPAGVISTVAGGGPSKAEGVAATYASLTSVFGLALDNAGDIYVTDPYRVREVTYAPPTQAAAPTFTPLTGTYTSLQNVTIADTTPGAVIFYTTDGTVPTQGSAVYTGPIAVNASTTLNAYAVSSGFLDSDVSTASVVISLPTAVNLSTSKNPALPGDNLTFTAAISFANSGTLVPTGSLTFTDGTFALGTVPLSQGAATASISTSALASGMHSISATYNGDSTFANSATTLNEVVLTVSNISWATPTPITYGTALSSAQLNATATTLSGVTIPGTLQYVPAAGTVLAAGEQTLTVVFTPQDSTTYTSATKSVSLLVSQAAPQITWFPVVTAITYGTPLTAQQLNASAAGTNGTGQAGTFVYTPAAGAVLNAGTQTLNVVFTPTDAVNYATVSKSTQIVVNPATPTVTFVPAVSSISYGTALGSSQLNATATGVGGATVPGVFVYTPAPGTVLGIGSQTLRVIFTPASSNYTTQAAAAQITVIQATPALTWATPAPIAYGTPLSASQLNATVTGVNGLALPGTFVYTPTAGTVLGPGTQTLSVVFTPTDSIDYAVASTSVKLSVTDLMFTSFTPNTAVIGDASKTITITGSGFVSTTVAQLGATPLATTLVSSTTLTAVVPASNFLVAGTLNISVKSPATGTTSTSLPLTVTAPTPSVTVTAPAMAAAGTQPAVNLAIANPYPVPLTATFTLTNAPASTPAVDDPAVQFATGGRTYTFTIPAGTTTVPNVQIQTGTVAGTISVTLVLTANGAVVTPTNAASPSLIVVPPAVPSVTAAALTRTTTSLTVTVAGFSNDREIVQANFHFVSAPGFSISTQDIAVPVGSAFVTWFANTQSLQYGSTFHYAQDFDVSDDASHIGSVIVTLTNKLGVSTSQTAQ